VEEKRSREPYPSSMPETLLVSDVSVRELFKEPRAAAGPAVAGTAVTKMTSARSRGIEWYRVKFLLIKEPEGRL
jgi:hypothetical protein